MGLIYDQGGTSRLRLGAVAAPSAAAGASLLREPLESLGYRLEPLTPDEAARARMDRLLWYAGEGQHDALERAMDSGGRHIVIAYPDGKIDDWAFALGRPGVSLVPASDPEGLIRALARAQGSRCETVREGAADDAVQRLRELGSEIATIAQALDRLGSSPALADRRPTYRGDAAEPGTFTAAQVRALIRARRVRDQHFAAELFADPAWDILLDLYAARLEGTQVAVSSLCIAAAVPPTTGLRWISAMTEQGMLVRIADPDDRRRVFIELSADAAERMAACLSAMLRVGGPAVA